jgi:hypothetical protein
MPPSKVAELCRLPLPNVRRALRELAASGRARRDILAEGQLSQLAEAWHVGSDRGL